VQLAKSWLPIEQRRGTSDGVSQSWLSYVRLPTSARPIEGLVIERRDVRSSTDVRLAAGQEISVWNGATVGPDHIFELFGYLGRSGRGGQSDNGGLW
jgi:hypothetical protein